MQALPSLQLAGQFPSHVSLPSVTLFPQTGVQLLSLLALHPGAQQPSPSVQVVIAVFVQTRLHAPALPDELSVVQELPSLQLTAQLPSHVSPDSTSLLPHAGLQSSSLLLLHPGAQQPSPSTHAVIALWLH